MKKIKSITLCSSVSFYRKCLELEIELKRKGFQVRIEHTARIMQQTGNFRERDYKKWHQDKSLYTEKSKLMVKHFREIEKGDAVLVVNETKRSIEGYIGGNVLMEMGIAFYLSKPIFLWNSPSAKSPLYEEIMGMLPVVIYQDLKKIK